MRRVICLLLASVAIAAASEQDIKVSQGLYERTEYRAALKRLLAIESPDAEVHHWIGRNYFMTGDYAKATTFFQKAIDLDPNNSDYMLWLGRSYGRRAETANPFAAPLQAAKARQAFEKAVELDGTNKEALNDLFDYYLEAPGFLGGGLDKAAALSRKIQQLDAAEYHFAQAQLADKRHQFDTAEAQLRRAAELAPRQVGRLVDLAKYLSKQGRIQESEATFQQAEKIAPNSHRLMFERASIYVKNKRNLDQARILLQRYIQSPLTPDDAPREQAEKLLKQAAGA